ncbi:alpha/beta hydrolase [Mycobacterium sp. AT1]|nr:alpha/beta hydrolase [Mycobacterium sp. AT1]
MTTQQRLEVDQFWRNVTTGGATIQEMRASFSAVMANFPIPPGVSTVEGELAGRRVLRLDPTPGRRPGTILYLHGGAYVLGSPEDSAPLTAHLVRRTGLCAISLDYRLAPEHPFPAAVEDAAAAYRALIDTGINPQTVVFAGDSAGGGLAVATLLAARNDGLPMPAAVVAFSPGLDATRAGLSMHTRAARDPVLTPEVIAATDAAYLNGADPAQELISPAICGDLTGLPPLLLQVGGNEVVLDDSVRLAARAAAADVDVILDITADVPHVFQSHAGSLDEADRALDRAAAFMIQHLAGWPAASSLDTTSAPITANAGSR